LVKVSVVIATLALPTALVIPATRKAGANLLSSRRQAKQIETPLT
jgi:hypothetical protein